MHDWRVGQQALRIRVFLSVGRLQDATWCLWARDEPTSSRNQSAPSIHCLKVEIDGELTNLFLSLYCLKVNCEVTWGSPRTYDFQ